MFEPVPSTRDTLCRNLQSELGSSIVTAEPVALSGESGSSVMYIESPGAGTNSMHQGTATTREVIQIQKLSADEFCSKNQINHIHLFKSDTEGHDFEVLSGAKDLFQREAIDIFQFEYNHRWVFSRHYLKDVYDFTAALPYSVGKVTPEGIEVYREWHPEMERFFEANYVIVQYNNL